MNTVTRIELDRIRRQAREAHRKSLIAERAAAWSQQDASYDWLRLLLVLAVLGIVAIIAYGVYARFTDTNDAATIRDIRAECAAQGYDIHIDRGADGRLLAVRCLREGEK